MKRILFFLLATGMGLITSAHVYAVPITYDNQVWQITALVESVGDGIGDVQEDFRPHPFETGLPISVEASLPSVTGTPTESVSADLTFLSRNIDYGGTPIPFTDEIKFLGSAHWFAQIAATTFDTFSVDLTGSSFRNLFPGSNNYFYIQDSTTSQLLFQVDDTTSDDLIQTINVTQGNGLLFEGHLEGDDVLEFEGSPISTQDTLSWSITAGPIEPIPEPTTMALLGIGLAGLAGGTVKRRFKRVKK